MDDREELRRLIDVIEKSSGSGSLEQAVDEHQNIRQHCKLSSQQTGHEAQKWKSQR